MLGGVTRDAATGEIVAAKASQLLLVGRYPWACTIKLFMAIIVAAS
jgi:hypothetical protein